MGVYKKKRYKKKTGRKPHKPTPEIRAKVKSLRACGNSQDKIALVLGMSEPTLVKYYKEELDRGIIEADTEVVGSLFAQACGAPAKFDERGNLVRAEQARSPAAAIFWCKARLGWKERTQHEVFGPDGDAIPLRVESLSDAQLAALIKRIELALGARPTS